MNGSDAARQAGQTLVFLAPGWTQRCTILALLRGRICSTVEVPIAPGAVTCTEMVVVPDRLRFLNTLRPKLRAPLLSDFLVSVKRLVVLNGLASPCRSASPSQSPSGR